MVDRTGQQAGEYRLARQLGTGTYGAVYQAEHEQHDWDVYQAEVASSSGSQASGQVAVKVFHTELTPELQSHFSTESQALHLQHPHIVHLHGSGFINNTPYVVMDLLPEGSLRQRYPLGSRVALAQVVYYVQQTAEALQFAHERGIVHRDLKPQNLLIRQNDEIVLSDFGIGVVLHAAGPLTRFELAESVPYAAPELLQGRPQVASDQYALAVIVYEWLCGVRPFTGTQESIIAQHQSLPPTPLRVYEPGILPAVEAVVLRALAKDPQARYPSIRDFAQALSQAAQPVGAYSSGSYGYGGDSNISNPAPGYGLYLGAGAGQVAMMYAPVAPTPARRKISPATIAMVGGIVLMAGNVFAALGLILLKFPQPSIEAGVPVFIVGMFLIAAGVLALALRFASTARTLAIAALIVFVVPLIGYTAMTLYTPSYVDQMSRFVLSDQEASQIVMLFSVISTVLLQLSSAGLICLGASLLKVGERLPQWTRPVGWGLMIASGVYILLLLLGIL